MIGIDINSIAGIKVDFYKRLSDYLDFDDEGNSNIDSWISEASRIGDLPLAKMYGFYKTHFDEMPIINSTNDLWRINDEFNSQFIGEILVWVAAKTYSKNPRPSDIFKKNTSFGKFKAKMESVYDGFMKEKVDGYENIGEWLSYKLNVVCCPYCNRHYTFTVLKKDGHPTLRPQFDHFLPKSLFPLTAVCLFNLIPACPDCNKLKGEKIIDIHPYEDSFDRRGIRFAYDLTSDRRNPKIEINDTENPNVSILALEDLYAKHSDIAADLINKAEAYNASYYSTLISSFPGLGMRPEEIDRAIWGISLNERDMIKRPFSKFTRDILFQLGIKS